MEALYLVIDKVLGDIVSIYLWHMHALGIILHSYLTQGLIYYYINNLSEKTD